MIAGNQRSQGHAKNVSIDHSLSTLPLSFGLRENRLNHNFRLYMCTPEECAENLRQGISDLSMIPAIEYGRAKESWLIVPGLSVASRTASKGMQLFFNSGLRNIQRIAMHNPACSEAILLRIVFREKYEMKPEYIQISGGLENMLQHADAALLTQNDVLANFRENRNRLDINEEWVNLTGLPFIYTFWAGREIVIDTDDIMVIQNSYELGKRNIENISREYAAEKTEDWAYFHDFLTKDIYYDFSDPEKDGLREFYNYSFYYGYLDHIPDIRFIEV